MQRPRNDVVILHYNEIALKLGHRAMFVSRLVQNVRRSLETLAIKHVQSTASRIVVELGEAPEGEVVDRLVQTPGVANVLPAVACEPTMEAIESFFDEILAWWRPTGSFRVDVKRADKSFPLKSPDVGARIGAMIASRTAAPVDLKRADSVAHVVIVQGRAYVSVAGKSQACGGLPVSTGGRVLLLLSGGIDSPVAGLRMMRRGCRVDTLHFHSAPYLDRTSQEKARNLCGVLARGQGPTRLTMVAFGEVQSEIVRSVPKPLRVVLYRRMMMRIASRAAHHDGLSALVTGESLGQVASQTLINLSIIERAAGCPVLRPLVGMEKLEITRYARDNDTFDISVVPDQDCCSLFVPKHPSTGASASEVEDAESHLDIETLVETAVEQRVRDYVEPVWGESAASLAAGI